MITESNFLVNNIKSSLVTLVIIVSSSQLLLVYETDCNVCQTHVTHPSHLCRGQGPAHYINGSDKKEKKDVDEAQEYI